MSWNRDYEKFGRIWGEGPGVLAEAAVRYLKKNDPDREGLDIIDIGCGYGRDVFYLSDKLKCNILGIDVSEKAIEIAMSMVMKTKRHNIRFQTADFASLGGDKYDVVFASNVYQIMHPDERGAFRNAVRKALRPEGLLFLATLSTKDPEHYGKGVQVIGEENSFKDGKYLHFCTGEELRKDFGFLGIKEFYEQRYTEPRSDGEVHHHVSWILTGSLWVDE
ncbi:MAG: class I SAM-dependent methyltransferase [Deltaproteobacteria bacterium]|nr:class I SAM-dependent methyltransferase [Deltaproteobacteria bacterium]